MSHQALSTRTPVTVALAWRRSVSTAVGAVLAVAGLCFVLGFVQGPFFAVRCVQISAESRSVAYEVADRIKLPQGANTLFTPLDDIVRAALACARVKQVQVRRKLPGTFVVVLVEYKPAAALRSGQSFVLVAEDGTALVRRQQRPADLPVITGLVSRLECPGQRLSRRQQSILSECIAACRQIGDPGWLEIDVSDSFEVACYTREGVQGKLGTLENLREKILLFAAIYRSLKAEGKNPLYIDVRMMQRPVWRPVTG